MYELPYLPNPGTDAVILTFKLPPKYLLFVLLFTLIKKLLFNLDLIGEFL